MRPRLRVWSQLTYITVVVGGSFVNRHVSSFKRWKWISMLRFSRHTCGVQYSAFRFANQSVKLPSRWCQCLASRFRMKWFNAFNYYDEIDCLLLLFISYPCYSVSYTCAKEVQKRCRRMRMTKRLSGSRYTVYRVEQGVDNVSRWFLPLANQLSVRYESSKCFRLIISLQQLFSKALFLAVLVLHFQTSCIYKLNIPAFNLSFTQICNTYPLFIQNLCLHLTFYQLEAPE